MTQQYSATNNHGPSRRPLFTPRLYLVTDTELCGGERGLVETVRAAAQGGVDIVQLRDHHATTRELAALATELLDVLAETDVPLVIDDRVDVALAVGAAGVHLGQSDLDPLSARRMADAIAGPEFHIGLTVNTTEQVDETRALPRHTIDLFGIGPFRATATKPDAAPPLDLDGVSHLTDATWDVGVPNVVIGGVKRDDISNLVASGAQGVAVVSAICGRTDPLAATRALRDAMDDALVQDADGEMSPMDSLRWLYEPHDSLGGYDFLEGA